MKIAKKPEIRFLNDMRIVLCDAEWAKKAKNLELYYMYRGVKKKDGLRYDITIMPPKMLGKEFLKTKGHRHSNKYGEIYVVNSGNAIFLFQKYANNKVEDVYAVQARKGDIVIVPSYYDHLTINPSNTKLELANWVSGKCKNIYDMIEEKHGACYFYTKKGWIKNKNYKNTPKLRFEKPLKTMPKNLDFLKE